MLHIFRSPQAFQQVQLGPNGVTGYVPTGQGPSMASFSKDTFSANGQQPLPPHASHPALPHLTLLVFEAVLEVVCVSLPGYIVARQGMFTAEMQKFTANLNVALFTPCLIFTKLASQLTAGKLVDLAIIPAIFIAQTLVSYIGALIVTKLFGFSKRPRNFVIAMGVFGNSNSLPISLVLSLSQTIKGLHWDKVPGDNDDEVAARGILYLLIFQQLGQLLRWSWGYNVLLAAPDKVKSTVEYGNARLEEGGEQVEAEREPLIAGEDGPESHSASSSEETQAATSDSGLKPSPMEASWSNTLSGEQTPTTYEETTFNESTSSLASDRHEQMPTRAPWDKTSKVTHAVATQGREAALVTAKSSKKLAEIVWDRSRMAAHQFHQYGVSNCRKGLSRAFQSLPPVIQSALMQCRHGCRRLAGGIWEFMNPPLWAMLAAILVASIPGLQHFFFANGTFFKNSVTSAIEQSGGVAVPLILVVLGGNLARNTLPSGPDSEDDKKEETKLLIASIISRMVFPFVIMAPILAVTAKYVPVSILDDPIFVIVCFLITGAPSALQLAQICQINNVYMGAMARLLFQSYVVWILPSTLVLVMCALEVVEWAQR